MTIIAIKGSYMAADSECATSRGLRSPMPFRKIFRGPGGLIGGTGTLHDLWAVGKWFEAGESGSKPSGLSTGEEGPAFLILRPDGSAWAGDEKLVFSPSPTPSTTGMATACYFCEGAMAAGLSALDAVCLTITRIDHIGGPVQVERVQPVEREAERLKQRSWLTSR